jgi:hypothetical protein
MHVAKSAAMSRVAMIPATTLKARSHNQPNAASVATGPKAKAAKAAAVAAVGVAAVVVVAVDANKMV